MAPVKMKSTRAISDYSDGRSRSSNFLRARNAVLQVLDALSERGS